MGEGLNFWDMLRAMFYTFRKDRFKQRRHRKPYATRRDKKTADYRAERKARNKRALASRKINRARAR